MGAPIAKRFLDSELALTVYDIDPANLAPFAAGGATIATSPKDVADKADIVFSCLPSTAICLDVALGENGVVHGSKIQTYVDTSTIGLQVARTIAEGLGPRIGFLDAPVSGGPPGARAGTLVTMVSGPQAAYDRALPAFEIIAKSIFYIGQSAGQAQIAKLVNNHLSAAGRIATFEGLVLALKAGLDPKVLIDLINVSSGRNYTTTDKVPDAILSGTFKFNGRLAISIKDQTLLKEEAEALGVPLWVAPRLLETLKEAADDGYLDQDSMLLIQYMGEQAGIDVRAIMTARQDGAQAT
ncbi:NAD(P)-dependent oxidoreductase [Sphingomonas sp. AP4-R1]|uniref:NAD(P)-dependent oxidoreductase n=1 Tax=Sphingomonas sp. AP4-R1 TaxID=2735134 RepID=UPI0014938419|nr:NAD(P)-dependent oxidoreductase [Sphingomonas sp. AP4-R1]QJU58146.1 NAD(P)-dependent oxidoreductase [Sphingomonas sp. AP4-R1]